MKNQPAPPKKWTVLVYSAADNDLKSYLVDDVDEMETVGSDEATDLVVQLDRLASGQGVRRPAPARLHGMARRPAEDLGLRGF